MVVLDAFDFLSHRIFVFLYGGMFHLVEFFFVNSYFLITLCTKFFFFDLVLCRPGITLSTFKQGFEN